MLRHFHFWGCLGLVTLLLVGCTANRYRKSADKEVAKAIAQKTPKVPNMDPRFTIQSNASISLLDLPVHDTDDAFFGDEKAMEKGARILSLDKALEIAVKQSKTYQNNKEVLYLQALSLTLARHRYTPIFTGNVNASTHAQQGIDKIVDDSNVEVNGSVQMDVLLRTGTRITTSFTTDFLRFLLGNQRAPYPSTLATTVTQPLWRGAGYKIAIENLTQAERDLLYALRNFTRYRKEFAVDIASAYYQVLQSRDKVRNSWQGLENFKMRVEQDTAYVKEGQRPVSALGLLKQAELNTITTWINAVRVYRQNLDQFKITIGLPVSTLVMLDDKELEQLKIVHPVIHLDDAITLALTNRLDLQNQKDGYEDAARRIKVAQNNLKPRVDLTGNVTVPARNAGSGLAPDFKNYTWSAGIDTDLGLERKSERNAYRSVLIAHERARRELELATDSIRLQIVSAWRDLDQAKRNYETSELGVQLSERRVEEEMLKAELGRGIPRDLVEAQLALIDSRDNRTSALINHTITRLKFWRDMGVLTIKDNGKWEETRDAQVK
jgi:outer membrane protein TolC